MSRFAPLMRLTEPFRLSAPALLAGALCFAAALSPSLVPRTGLLQGVLGGLSFTAGYFCLVLVLMCWRMLELPEAGGRAARISQRLCTAAALLVMGLALSQVSRWQNEIRALMELPPAETARPFIIAATALALAFALIWLGRLFRSATLTIEARLARHIPRRLAFLLGLGGAALLFSVLGNDLLLRRGLAAFDASYAALDRAIPDHSSPPSDPLKTGAAQSLISWQSIGAEGRNRVLDPIDAAQITQITGAPALEPLRVYVGLGSAETPAERAELALREALRIGAFERSRLVITTPTGTGWIDPAGMVPLEVLSGGDLATVAVQYSYLPSWLALLTVQDYGRETAQAVFETFHRYWRKLPADSRPELWLWGLSLGAMNSDLSIDLYDLLAHPIAGAFRAGPPFAGPTWMRLTERRDPGSPAWRPVYSDGRTVRFMNQAPADDDTAPLSAASPSGSSSDGTTGISPTNPASDWGPVRILYLQYATDGITFFSPSILWREPDWMKSPRGPGMPDSLRWIPLVTFFQIGFDLLTATTTPAGHGHVYAARDYLAGWHSLFGGDPLPERTKTGLKALFTERGL